MDEIFKLLGDDTRLRIIQMLAEHGEVCVCVITEKLGLNQPQISQHIARLRQAGLLNARKEGQWVHYSLNIDAINDGPLALLESVVRTARESAREKEASCSETDYALSN